MLRIEKLIVGMVRTNCYLGMNTETKEGFIVDPADHGEEIIQKINGMQMKPIAILLTHGHFDHIGAAQDLKKEYQIPICMMMEEKVVAEDRNLNLSGAFGLPFEIKGDVFFADGEERNFAGMQVKVLYTPGHTKGGACYYLSEEKTLFSGDTLFCESIGRTDFPTGSQSVLVNSVRNLLKMLPEDTSVYPGHEEMTDIAHEKKCNPYV